MILLFLSNSALYPAPITDPWFNAQVPVIESGKVGPYILYAAQQPVSVLGCTDQTEICNPAIRGSKNCTSLPPGFLAHTIASLSAELQLNSRQAGVLSRFYEAIHNGVDIMAEIGNDGGLLASAMTNYWLSAELPPDQWILELQHWFAIFLTSIQLGVVEYVTGLDNPSYNHWLTPPSREEEWMCTNQIVQRNDYASFSVLGLAFILCSGGLAMLVNVSLSTVWPRLWYRSALDQYRKEQWKSTELLELQRITHNPAEQSRVKSDQAFESWCSVSSTRDKALSDLEALRHHTRSTAFEESVVDRHGGQLHHESSSATIEVQLQQDDFPPHELARLMSERP